MVGMAPDVRSRADCASRPGHGRSAFRTSCAVRYPAMPFTPPPGQVAWPVIHSRGTTVACRAWPGMRAQQEALV